MKVLIATLLLSASAFAGQNICDQAPYHSVKVECVAFESQHRFNQGAYDLCNEGPYYTAKVDCLKKIANKQFTAEIVRVCSEAPYFTAKIDCLMKHESKVTCIGKKQVSDGLRYVLASIIAGEQRRSATDLSEIIAKVEACPGAIE